MPACKSKHPAAEGSSERAVRDLTPSPARNDQSQPRVLTAAVALSALRASEATSRAVSA